MSIKLEKRWIEKLNDLVEGDFRIEDYDFKKNSYYQEVLNHLAKLRDRKSVV